MFVEAQRCARGKERGQRTDFGVAICAVLLFADLRSLAGVEVLGRPRVLEYFNAFLELGQLITNGSLNSGGERKEDEDGGLELRRCAEIPDYHRGDGVSEGFHIGLLDSWMRRRVAVAIVLFLELAAADLADPGTRRVAHGWCRPPRGACHSAGG